MFVLRVFVLSITVLLLGCDGSSNSSDAVADESPMLALSFSQSPVELSGVSAQFAADVAYGDGERNYFDIFLPDSDEPTPLVIYFHGGAYAFGDKSEAYDYHAADIEEFLQAGVAFATVNYHLLSVEEPLDPDGVIRSLDDSARALQFMRYQAANLNIDPEQVASYGVSAGASTSLWLGTHDDLADPENEDRVLRESTRVKAVGALVTQATLDIRRWEEILLPVVAPLAPLFGGSTDIPSVAANLGQSNLLFTIMGISSFDELLTPEFDAYGKNIDSLLLMDAGDAPIYARNDNSFFGDDLVNLFLHHTLHVLTLKKRADEVGLESVMYAIDPVYSLDDPSGEGHVSFLLRHIR